MEIIGYIMRPCLTESDSAHELRSIWLPPTIASRPSA